MVLEVVQLPLKVYFKKTFSYTRIYQYVFLSTSIESKEKFCVRFIFTRIDNCVQNKLSDIISIYSFCFKYLDKTRDVTES